LPKAFRAVSPRVAALEKQAVDELASLLSTLRKQQRAK
jgi:hypothetical protein